MTPQNIEPKKNNINDVLLNNFVQSFNTYTIALNTFLNFYLNGIKLFNMNFISLLYTVNSDGFFQELDIIDFSNIANNYNIDVDIEASVVVVNYLILTVPLIITSRN